MKKLFLMLISLSFIGVIGYGQIVSSSPITKFTFTISKTVVMLKKLSGNSVSKLNRTPVKTWRVH